MQITGLNSSFNMSVMIGLRTYQASSRAAAKAMEHIATGKRINRTSDDPSGAAAADSLARDAIDLSARLKGAERSKAVLGTADGGLSVLGDLLTNLNALVVSASSTGGSTPEERRGMQLEAESILQGIDVVLNNTSFDNAQVLREGFSVSLPDGSFGFAGMSLKSLGAQEWVRQGLFGAKATPPAETPAAEGAPPEGVPAPAAAPPSVSLDDIRTALNLVDGDTETAQSVVKGALDYVNATRADFGTKMKYDLGARLNVTRAQLEGVTSEYSRIVDADYAVEVSALVRAQLLQQVSLASLQGIFDAQRQNAFGLLRG